MQLPSWMEGNKQFPEYVTTTLAKGPTHPILNRFDEKTTVVEVSALIAHHEGVGMSQDIINDRNIASYII